MPSILLVEDDPVAQDLVKGILESRGWVVDTAADGFASLNMLRERSYAAALLDYHLPEMDGYALARLMRDICQTRQQPLRLIGMTADRDGLAARRGVDSLFDAILAKPFAPGDLLALVDKVVLRAIPATGFAEAASPLPVRLGGEQARQVSKSLWAARGLAGFPKAHVVPTPTADQADAIQLCFDLVDEASAELVLIVDVLGFHELIRSRTTAVPRLPIVTLARELSIIADGYFAVADANSWSAVAALLQRGAACPPGQAAKHGSEAATARQSI